MPEQTEITLTDDERSILLHSLGVEYPRGKRKPKPYRNYYCAEIHDARLPALVQKGLMQAGRVINDGRDQYFHVTEAGAAAVGHQLPKDD